MPKHMRRILVAAACAALLGPRAASGQTIEPSFRADIEKLLEVTGAAQMGTQIASIISGQIINGLKTSQPSVPDRALDLAKSVLDSEFAKAFSAPDGLTQQIIAIYAKNFTQDDVRGLLAFYRTDLGRKTIRMMPVVMQEGAAAGQQWAEREMPRIAAVLQQRLRAEGLIK
jgi:uncharacterized protein